MLAKKIMAVSSVLLLAGWGCNNATNNTTDLKNATGQDPYFEQNTAKLEVKNQAKGKEMIVPTVVATQDSWVVIRADKGGVPGDVIGFTAVGAGEHKDVKVMVDESKVTKVLHTNLYVDLGEKGKFENGGADVPVTANDVGVSGSFSVTGV